MGGADMFFDRVSPEQVTYIFDNELEKQRDYKKNV